MLQILGGTLYDPLHGICGEVRDLWIDDGKIIAPPDTPVAGVRQIDARGLVVMPGGVDMHCHIAGPKVNTARRLQPEDKSRSLGEIQQTLTLVRPELPFSAAAIGSVPSTYTTGYRYAGLGYTTAFDAAIAPLGARHTHLELADTPCIDAGFFVLVGNNHFVLESLKQRDQQKLTAFLGWLLSRTKAYAPKIVNPGGVENWKCGHSGTMSDLDTRVDGFGVTPRAILQSIAQAAAALNLPHAVHIHCNNLGLPGNWSTTLETMKSLDGFRAHLTHVQFHSYAGGQGDEATFGSQVLPLAEYINQHPQLTVDVGQVYFGPTTSMTGDSAVGYYLSQLYRTKWVSHDLEQEAGCGIVPIEYRQKSVVHAWQWAIGLEWYLLVENPWQIAMSTDHPNGGSFLAYPHIIRLLMDRTYRLDVLKTLPAQVREHCLLKDLKREYTLEEICIITRAAPAKMLGLQHKGHLGPGADADITIYTPDANYETMFQLPRTVIQAGRVLVDQGELRESQFGQTHYVAPDFDRDYLPYIQAWFEQHYSLDFEQYGV